MLQPATQIRIGRVRRLRAHELGNDLLRQQLEGLCVAEKAGDIDEQIVGEVLEFGGVLGQQFEIAVAVLDAGHGHAPLDPAPERALLVERKIMRGLFAQQIDDLRQPSRRMGSAASLLPVLRYR